MLLFVLFHAPWTEGFMTDNHRMPNCLVSVLVMILPKLASVPEYRL